MPNHTTWTVSGSLVDEAAFRTWWKSWRTAFTAVGMVRIDDDGTDPDATLPTLSPVYASGTNREITWEVWRFPTTGLSVQSTSPLVIRVGYGQAASSSAPRMQITVGTGAGTGGAITPANGIGGLGALSVITASSGSSASHWMACDDNGLVFVTGANSTTSPRLVVIDRLRDPGTGLPLLTAANVSVGVVLAHVFANSGGGGTIVSTLRVFDPTENSADAAATVNVPCVVTPGTMSLVATYTNNNGQTQLYPWWASSKNGSGALKMVATYNRSELGGTGTEVDAAWMPSSDPTRTMKLLADWGFGFDWTGSNAAACAVWWAD